ncbi:MAG: carboxyl transferase domain-containing protein [Desulfobacterales bacterium]
MVWEPEVEELKHRHSLAEKMGGEEGIAKQHSRGKLTVRERIAGLVDPDSFREIGKLAGTARYEGDTLVGLTPGNSVMGLCEVNGQKVALSGGDFTIRGGSADGSVNKGNVVQMALDWRLPYVRLLDATGGSVKSFAKMGRTYIPDANPYCALEARLLNVAPVVSAVMGSVAGLPAVEACMAHFSLMVKGTSQVFPGGPPVVKAALGDDVTKEELGGEEIQAYQGGVIDNVAEDEQDAFRMIRRFLSYMPGNVWKMPPRLEPTDDPGRRDEELLSIIPRKKNKPYDPHKLLNHVLDRDSLFEISPHYGRSRIIALARMNGYPVGVMINNPRHLGGSTDVAAGTKVIRFMQICNTFHLPMIYFADEPGFMVGMEAQRQGILRAGAKIVCATCETRMPWITVITRQLFGVAGQLHNRPGGMYKRLAWPSGNWGSMHIEGGTSAAYRRVIESAPDPEAKRLEIEASLKALASPFKTAEATGLDIIDPRDTRPLICDFIEMAQDILQTQLGPTHGPGFQP